MERFEVVSPTGRESIAGKAVSPRLDTLDGKTVGETWNHDFKGDYMFPVYRELLKQRYLGIRIIPYTEFPASPLSGTPSYQREISQRIADLAREKGCNAMISGNGG